MQATVEISLYPLTDDYESVVLAFLDDLEQEESITFSTNGMSTQIFGEAADIFAAVGRQFEKVQETGKAILVLKAGPGKLRYEGRHSRKL
ncbi:YkoF family thiamine/hydroxymethylpyrimidine-binding protein [Puniceicoccus vermicola]|uniref:Thiamin/hydroxymethyl pyrimidine-binding YkoF putative domain-containing protein n=1 Tax=Puniceicoccus vermicola TaxID=388746 RepID=A0A7X1AWK7_9BACT|nr:YkoF family thiamine/hydroxymethylpyrimidine-binding protein [Puniceicoccus vermicola]MBC2601330.1 hypothetical protein [Puniceicoccus vermicola]